MDSRERVMRTLEFKGTDRIPTDIWVLPAAQKYAGKITFWGEISRQNTLPMGSRRMSGKRQD